MGGCRQCSTTRLEYCRRPAGTSTTSKAGCCRMMWKFGNTSFIVFPDQRFAEKREAKAYLKKLGLLKLIDEAVGTIILIQPEKEEYGESDLQHCYTLVNALFSQKAFVEVDGKRAVPAEAEYCGGYGKTYMFGVGKGATFMNNYVAPSRDELIGRVAGYFTYGGEMCDAARVSQYVPAFLVNACGVAVQKFRRANKIRPNQVDKVMANIDACSEPSIVVGDFNDTPLSYTYSRLSRGRKDSFLEVGKGFGATYCSLWPMLRIDYILYPETLKARWYDRGDVKYSDHYPILSSFLQ